MRSPSALLRWRSQRHISHWWLAPEHRRHQVPRAEDSDPASDQVLCGLDLGPIPRLRRSHQGSHQGSVHSCQVPYSVVSHPSPASALQKVRHGQIIDIAIDITVHVFSKKVCKVRTPNLSLSIAAITNYWFDLVRPHEVRNQSQGSMASRINPFASLFAQCLHI